MSRQHSQDRDDESAAGTVPGGPTELQALVVDGPQTHCAAVQSGHSRRFGGCAELLRGSLALSSDNRADLVAGAARPSATQTFIDNVTTTVPCQARDILVNAIRELQQSKGLAGSLAIIGLAGALWSASAYIGAFMRMECLKDTPCGRPCR
jgi:hypothetical protein